MPKLILDLCGGTGAWSKFYRDDPRYEVVLITLPDYDVTKVTITDQSITFWSQTIDQPDGKLHIVIPLVKVYGILAAPPCTQFSLANTRQTYAMRPDWEDGMRVVKACLEIIWACQYKNALRWWALENPFGHLRKFLGMPGYEFQAWWFDGEVPFSKRMELWGWFAKPVATVHERPAHLQVAARDEHRQHKQWYRPECPEEYAHLGLDRQAIRSITPSGFAQAFRKANP